MAMYRKLGKKSDARKALLRNQVTQLLYHGKIETTEARAKEVRKIAEHLITLAIKEKDNFDEVTVSAKVAKKDKDGKPLNEPIDKFNHALDAMRYALWTHFGKEAGSGQYTLSFIKH